MTKHFKYLIVLLFAIGGAMPAMAQKVKVDAHLEKATIPLGDQTKLHLTITFSAKDSVSFPKLADTLKGNLQIISVNKPDTSFDKNDVSIETIDRSYTISSFDTGQYVIPQYELKIKADTFKTPELVLTVTSVAVDTTKGIHDIKQPFKVDYSVIDWIKDNPAKTSIPILAIAIIAAAIWYLRTRPKKEAPPKPAEPEKPEHVIALDKLYALREQKLWQQDRTKEYHSEISEVMRDYLERRYSIHANEQTTDEIFASIRYMDINEADRAKLKQILVLADLVKFAKERPLPQDNEQSISNAIDFILKTQKRIAPPIPPKDKEGENDGLV